MVNLSDISQFNGKSKLNCCLDFLLFVLFLRKQYEKINFK